MLTWYELPKPNGAQTGEAEESAVKERPILQFIEDERPQQNEADDDREANEDRDANLWLIQRMVAVAAGVILFGVLASQLVDVVELRVDVRKSVVLFALLILPALLGEFAVEAAEVVGQSFSYDGEVDEHQRNANKSVEDGGDATPESFG